MSLQVSQIPRRLRLSAAAFMPGYLSIAPLPAIRLFLGEESPVRVSPTASFITISIGTEIHRPTMTQVLSTTLAHFLYLPELEILVPTRKCLRMARTSPALHHASGRPRIAF